MIRHIAIVAVVLFSISVAVVCSLFQPALFIWCGIGLLIGTVLRLLLARKHHRSKDFKGLGHWIYVVYVTLLVGILVVLCIPRLYMEHMQLPSTIEVLYVGEITLDSKVNQWTARERVTVYATDLDYRTRLPLSQSIPKDPLDDPEEYIGYITTATINSLASSMNVFGWDTIIEDEHLIGERVRRGNLPKYKYKLTRIIEIDLFEESYNIGTEEVLTRAHRESVVHLTSPQYYILSTFPISDQPEDRFSGKPEYRRISLHDGGPNIRAISIQGVATLLRNPVGFTVAKLSFWRVTNWIVIVIAGIIGAFIKELFTRPIRWCVEKCGLLKGTSMS